ncbi:MAG: GGDEF domain-containing protein [Thermoleophilia bacterium]|nr:GGDEF domain-containing protein [Thermoleophilia bacterium]
MNVVPPDRDAPGESNNPLFAKAQNVLESHKLDITKAWLNRIIAQIDDLSTLEGFPTQESIQVSVELIEGLAAALRDPAGGREFEPGGRYYERAGMLGALGGRDAQGLVSLSQSMLALENAVWELLVQSLRKEDRNLLALVMRLREALHGVFTASTESYYIRSNTELDRLAHTDVLTGLYNRRYMVQELERHVEIFKRYRHPFSLLMLDLDYLKWINDNYGHPAGDAALKHVATMLKVNVRDVDIPCRYGGDEFVVLMPETEKDAVESVGARIIESLHKTKLKLDHSLVSLEMSVGISSCPEDGRESEELLQEADASLYRAKQRKTEALGGQGQEQ